MHIFGLTFILFVLKISAGKGFWFNLRMTDNAVYKIAIQLERSMKKYEKCKLDIEFLCRCRDTNINPNFTKLKQLKAMDSKNRFKFCRKLLCNEIAKKHKRLKQLNQEISDLHTQLNTNCTWLKRKCIFYSINFIISKQKDDIKSRHNRKFDNLLRSKRYADGIKDNPNEVIWNFSSKTLSNDEYEVLKYGLNHGLATSLVQTDVIPSIESVWDQLIRNNLLKTDLHSLRRAKNCLRALAFNLIDIDNPQIYKDIKKRKIIQELRKTTAILKPDKGNGIVIIDINDYVLSLENLFSDNDKFVKITNDPTHTRLDSLQKYLLKLLKRKEITQEIYNEIRPQNAKISRAHGLPKVHKQFDRVPPF